MTILAVLF